MSRVRSFLLIFIALWLPLQVSASWTMPLCAHAHDQQSSQAMQAQSEEMETHCHEHVGAGDVTAATAAAADDLGCDNCGICHLASTGFLLSTDNAMGSPLAVSVLVPRLKAETSSHIGSPPQQPPKRLN